MFKNKFVKAFLSVLAIIFIIIIAGITYLTTALPNVGQAPDLKILSTEKSIARGEYLFNSVAACASCHSTRDWNLFAGPVIEGTLGIGGEKFGPEDGFPGNYYASNITPYHLGNYTDGELYRVLTTGVNKEGKALFPIMPYQHYAKMTDEDIYSIIAYLRTLPSIKKDITPSESNFPMNIIIHTIPKKAIPVKAIDTTNLVVYGEYLVNAGTCIHCHSKDDKGTLIKGMEFAGGVKFKLPKGGSIISSNITPHATGIGNWTESKFIEHFQQYKMPHYKPTKADSNSFNSLMPYTQYAGITTSDLKAMFTYLKTIKPVDNRVEKFIP